MSELILVLSCFLFAWIGFSGCCTSGDRFSILDFDAAGDGETINTKAINACTNLGGGIVFFPAGRYLSGTLMLKDNVTFELREGATLLGSTNLDDYPG